MEIVGIVLTIVLFLAAPIYNRWYEKRKNK